MVTMESADNALKTLYLGVITEQLNTESNPLLAEIKQSTADVWGKEIRRVAQHGLNGGVGAGTEDGDLPEAAGNNYGQFVTTLKNLYGTIEISDKAMRASENDAGAFVNLLNAEMEGLVKAASFNFGRMLFGDGSGKLGEITAVTDNTFTVTNVKNFVDGLLVDVYDADGNKTDFSPRRIVDFDRVNGTVTLGGTKITSGAQTIGGFMTVQGSYNQEITGLGAIFKDTGTLYGLDRSKNKWLVPYMRNLAGNLTEHAIQTAIDHIEETVGGKINLIICSTGVRRSYMKYLNNYKRDVNTMELKSGFKAMSYNGIPIIADRFCPNNTMYLLNTEDFTLHQLCDWKWLEGEDGRVIKQVAGKPTYTATLVKYADLICTRPCGQAMITGINET